MTQDIITVKNFKKKIKRRKKKEKRKKEID